MRRFTVVTIRRTRADYIVEAADARDAWNRVALVEHERHEPTECGVVVSRKPMEIDLERFVIEVPRPSPCALCDAKACPDPEHPGYAR